MSNYKIIKFGQRIKKLRETKGFTQEKLAFLVDVDTSYIGKIERGTMNPSLKKIFKIAEILEVEPADLFEEKEDSET